MAPKLMTLANLPLFYTKNWHADLEFACKFCVLVSIIIIPELFPYTLPLGASVQLILELHGLTARPNTPHSLPTDPAASGGRGVLPNINSKETIEILETGVA